MAFVVSGVSGRRGVRGGRGTALEGSDPGYLWIPTKPGCERVGVQPPKPGLTRAAVRTLHAAHRNLVLQVIGVPLRPYALLPPPVTLLRSRP